MKYSRALITGASSGIGEAFARRLAAQGTNLILVARSEANLNSLAAELSKKYDIHAEVIPADLSNGDAAHSLHAEVTHRNLGVDLLINNAGFGSYSSFEKLPLERETQEIALNMTALVALTHLFLPEMLAKEAGAVINVASTAGFQPVPYMAVYGATKAFVLSFSEALWAECRPQGVRILALCPGATDTRFAGVAGTNLPSKGATAESVADAALAALARGRSYFVPGGGNYRLSLVSRFTPRAVTARIAERMMRP